MTKLPDGWERVPLANVADTQLGKMLNSSKQTGTASIPYLRNVNLRWGSVDLDDLKFMDVFENELEKFTLRYGDVLICEGGEPGRAAVWRAEPGMAFQNAIHRVRPSEVLLADFLSLQFEWLTKAGFLSKYFTGVTIKHFSQEKLRKVEITLPPVDEQDEIVRILDTQLARLDAVLGAVQAARVKAAQFRRSLLFERLEGNISESIQKKQMISIDVRDFSSTFEVITRGFTKVKQRDYEPTGVVPVVDQGRLERGGFISDPELRFLGDLPVIAFGDHTRAVKFIDFEFAVGADGLKLLRTRNDVEPRFGYYLLEACELPDRGYARHFSSLRNLRFKVPSLEQQRETVDDLDTQLTRLDAVLRGAERVELECGRLRRSLLQAAFSGELTREWRLSNG